MKMNNQEICELITAAIRGTYRSDFKPKDVMPSYEKKPHDVIVKPTPLPDSLRPLWSLYNDLKAEGVPCREVHCIFSTMCSLHFGYENRYGHNPAVDKNWNFFVISELSPREISDRREARRHAEFC